MKLLTCQCWTSGPAREIMSAQALLLISRNDILEVSEGPESRKLFQLLSWLTRNGFHLMATAAMPDPNNSRERWLKGGGDPSLFGPGSIRSKLDEAGGTLDGVYYVPRSFIAQNRNRIRSLDDVMKRYAVSPQITYLYSSSRKWAEAAEKLDIRSVCLAKPRKLIEELARLKQLAKTP